LQKRKTRGGGGGEIIMRVIVMRIQIFSNVFHRIANFGKFFSFVAKFFFSQKIKKK